MGKQNARLYFQGKDHKDIYYNGYYHDAMYLTDGEGNATLVWEKIKGTLVKHVSMLSYVNGKYYAVAESTQYMTDEGFPVLYEGKSLNSMRGKCRIFGDVPVRGASHIMYADSNELIIIRTYMYKELMRFIARIPIGETGADMENILYGMEAGAYKFSNYTTSYRRYFYGNGNNYYYYDTREKAFFKNDNKLEGGINPDIAIGGEMIGIGTIGSFSSFEAYWQFNIFHGEDEEVRTCSVSLTKILEDARRSFGSMYGWNNLEGITVSSVSRTGAYIMVSSTAGYIYIKATLRNRVNSKNYVFEKIYRIKINFKTFDLLEWEDMGTSITYGVNSYMIGTGKYRVQIAVQKGQSGLSYGLIGGDYSNDVFIRKAIITNLPSYVRTDFEYYRICSLADNGSTLIIKIGNDTASVPGFIVVDVKDKTAKYAEIDIYSG